MNFNTRAPRTLLLPVLGVCILLASGCSSPPLSGDGGTMPDGARNHPITVEPSYKSLKVTWFPGAGLNDDEAMRLDAFVADYRDHGSGSIAVSAPATPAARAAAGYFTERLNQMGIARDKILVASHDAPDGDGRVEVNYVAYKATTKECGDWSENLAFTLDNATPKNFGCSVQQNIAAMVADPRDLLGPRGMGESDGARRTTVMGLYEQGKITANDKRKVDLRDEQSGLSSGSDHAP